MHVYVTSRQVTIIKIFSNKKALIKAKAEKNCCIQHKINLPYNGLHLTLTKRRYYYVIISYYVIGKACKI